MRAPTLFTLAIMAATLAFAQEARSPSPPSPASPNTPAIRVELVHPERWSFRIVTAGEPAGSVVVDFFKQEDALWIHDISTMGSDVHEDVSIVLDPGSAVWRSAAVSGQFSGTHVHASYAVDRDRVRGVFARHRLADGRRAETQVDQELPEGTLARGVAIWLVHAMPWEEGIEYRFPWFAFLGAQVEQVSFRHSGIESIAVPAGTFEVHRIEQQGGTPGNVLYVTTAAPHRTVRVDVVGQPMTIELESVEPHSPAGS